MVAGVTGGSELREMGAHRQFLKEPDLGLAVGTEERPLGQLGKDPAPGGEHPDPGNGGKQVRTVAEPGVAGKGRQ